jgi:hypothetical protein
MKHSRSIVPFPAGRIQQPRDEPSGERGTAFSQEKHRRTQFALTTEE